MPQLLNGYAFAANNPFKYGDSSGEWFETAWDAASLVMGISAVVEEPSLLNVAAVGVDILAVALPVVPGGAGAAIKASKAAKSNNRSLERARNTFRHYTNRRGSRGILEKNTIHANKQGKVFAEKITRRNKNPLSKADAEDKYGLGQGRGRDYVEFNLPDGQEAVMQKNPITEATEWVIRGDVPLGADPRVIQRR